MLLGTEAIRKAWKVALPTMDSQSVIPLGKLGVRVKHMSDRGGQEPGT